MKLQQRFTFQKKFISEKIEREMGTMLNESFKGEYKGFKYYIQNGLCSPCAYIKIPKEHPLYKIDFCRINMYVHGGLTYSNEELFFQGKPLKGWFIGWGYCHSGDFMNIGGNIHEGKIHTLKDIKIDCTAAITDLINGDYEIYGEE